MAYAVQILTTDDLPTVRRLVDPTLDEPAAPDELLLSDPIVPTAEQTVLALWPDALAARPAESDPPRAAGADPDPDVWHWVRLAALRLAAAELVPLIAAARLKRESFDGQHTYERDAWDAPLAAATLRTQASEALQAAKVAAGTIIVPVTVASRVSGLFAAAGGRRGVG